MLVNYSYFNVWAAHMPFLFYTRIRLVYAIVELALSLLFGRLFILIFKIYYGNCSKNYNSVGLFSLFMALDSSVFILQPNSEDHI